MDFVEYACDEMDWDVHQHYNHSLDKIDESLYFFIINIHPIIHFKGCLHTFIVDVEIF